MNDHDTEMVGEYCQAVLDHPIFRMLCNNYEQSQLQRIQNSLPDQPAVREDAYHLFRGAKDFLEYMNSFVEQKDALGKERDQHRQLVIEAGLNPDMPPDEEVLLGDDIRFE